MRLPHFPNVSPIRPLGGECLVFVVGLGWTFSQTYFQDFKDAPPAIGVLLALPVIVIPLAVLAAYHAFVRGGTGSGLLPAISTSLS